MKAFASIIAAIAAVSAAGADGATAFVPYRDLFLVAEVPAKAHRDEPGSFSMDRAGVSTRFQLIASTPHVNERELSCENHPVQYRVSNARLFAYSCLVGGSVRYHAEKYGATYRVGASDATETIEFNITYPAAQRAYWDPIVARVSKSLRFARRPGA